MLINYLIFFGIGFISQLILVGYTFGQLLLEKSQIDKYWYLFLIIGGIQTITVMTAVKYGVYFTSVLTIQLILLMFAHSLTYLLNYLYLKNTKASLIDLLSFSLMISGIYISKKFETINPEFLY
ncbi:hypothetical protein CPAV1605_656 [seawater metagenome]|uniref:Uncharacterized protein n=1 Tax=seawater metagenome TaxID=1561972 RepID=A0A5E8CIA3_9ZZZZ